MFGLYKRHQGFTLLELLITLAVLGILASLAVPNLRESAMNNQLKATANSYFAIFKYARAEAMRTGTAVTVAPLSLAQWDSGAVVSFNGQAQRQIKTDGDVNLATTGLGTTLVYDGSGAIGAATTLTFCDSRTAERGYRLSILASGLAVLNRVACA